MARGWESKSVESQIDSAEVHHNGAVRQKEHPPLKLEAIRRKETLELSRTRVARELAATANQRYKTILNKALADLDAQIAGLAD